MKSNVFALSFSILVLSLTSLQTAHALEGLYGQNSGLSQAANALNLAQQMKAAQEQKKANDEIYYFTNYVPKELKKNRQAVLKQQDPATKKSLQDAFNKNAEGYSSEIKAQYDKLSKVAEDKNASKKERKNARKKMDKLKQALREIAYEKQLVAYNVEKSRKNFTRADQVAALKEAKEKANAIISTPATAVESSSNSAPANNAASSVDQGSSSSVSSGSK